MAAKTNGRREPSPEIKQTAVAYMENVTSEHARRVFTGYEDIVKRFGPDSDAERIYRMARPVQAAMTRQPSLRLAMSWIRKAYIPAPET